MEILQYAKRFYRVVRYAYDNKRNSRFLSGEYVVMKNALTSSDIESIRKTYQISLADKNIAAEIVEERYVFYDQSILEILNQIEVVRSAVLKFRPAQSFSHVLRNIIKESSTTTGSGGGWHRDSLIPQLKIFVPLTSVNSLNGATEIIPNSSSLRSKIGSILGGLRVKNSASFDSEQLHLNVGDLALVNTSCIHRGSPPKEAGRDMITIYFYSRASN